MKWTERSPEYVGNRYDRLARWYRAFEWGYALPFFGVRKKAIRALGLRAGDSLVEVGCGSGYNFRRILEAIGPEGSLAGIDMSPGMLARAESLCARRGFDNVSLTRGDALVVPLPERIDAVLFSFSYSTMCERERILERYWNALAPGGRLVILDLHLPEKTARWQHDMGVWVSQRTLLGRPDVVPWAHLETLAAEVERQESRFATSRFVVCRAEKP